MLEWLFRRPCHAQTGGRNGPFWLMEVLLASVAVARVSTVGAGVGALCGAGDGGEAWETWRGQGLSIPWMGPEWVHFPSVTDMTHLSPTPRLPVWASLCLLFLVAFCFPSLSMLVFAGSCPQGGECIGCFLRTPYRGPRLCTNGVHHPPPHCHGLESHGQQLAP